MQNTKNPLASKSVWGSVIVMVGALLGWSASLQGDITQFADEAITLIGVAMALWGRVRANSELAWKKPKLKINRLPIFLPFIILPLICGCAGATSMGKIEVGALTGDLLIVDIGSNSQMPVEGGTTVDASGTVPGTVPVPINLAIERTGLLSGQSLSVETVGGSIIIQRAFVGTQNVELEHVLPTVFIPCDNPLGDINTDPID